MTITADHRSTRRVYHLISADSHVNEPPDLWTTRLPHQFAGRAPRMERFEQGDAWIFEGVDAPIPFGLNACAGMDPAMHRAWVRWEDLRRGGWDPAARVAEIALDGVDAEVLFPTPRLAHVIFAQADADYHTALIRAYNDWLADYCEYDTSKFRGMAMLPCRGVAGAVAEIERTAERDGIGGYVIGGFPTEVLRPTPADDPAWACLVERGMPLAIHVGLTTGMPAATNTSTLPAAGRFNNITETLIDLVFSGMLERFPELQVVIAEDDCGWLPYFKEQVDDNFRRFRHRFDLPLFPSEYLERQVHFTYVVDTYGIDNRERIGVDRILWSSDYPHASAYYPHSWPTVQASLGTVPVPERNLILFGNAERLFGFGR
jgi:predicted TIM-barrel fold metal-dependent hydrolase